MVRLLLCRDRDWHWHRKRQTWVDRHSDGFTLSDKGFVAGGDNRRFLVFQGAFEMHRAFDHHAAIDGAPAIGGDRVRDGVNGRLALRTGDTVLLLLGSEDGDGEKENGGNE